MRKILLAFLLLSTGVAHAQTCTGTNPSGAAAARGLYAEYYTGYYADNQSYFTSNSPVLARTDTAANFQTSSSFGDLVGAGVTTSGTATNPDYFSARYRGSFYAPSSTTYTFYLNSDDASAMWIDNDALTSPPVVGNALINNNGAHSAATKQASIYLVAGFHNLLLHYGEAGGDNVLTLRFSTSTISQRYVPSKLLCSSVQPTAPAATALTYAPLGRTVLSGTVGSSPVPSLTKSAADVAAPYYELLNAPTGVTINAATGVLTAAATVAVGTYTLSMRVTTASGPVFANAFTFSVVANPNADCSGTDAGGSPAANGLYAKYYPGYFNDVQSFFSGTAEGVVRVDAQLNFGTSAGWGVLTPPASNTNANPNTYSSRYQGSLLIGTAGSYTFALTSDDASFMWLDNPARRATMVSSEAVVNNGGMHSSKTVSATVTLAAGKHDLVVHFGENDGDNILTLQYSGPDTGNSLVTVPSSALCSSTTGLPLPVVLTQFDAQPGANSVSLVWHTAQELNSAYFAVERSVDGHVFHEILQAAGAGNTTVPQAYQALDRAPLTGLAYYRLRLVDYDGTFAYSPIVAVTMGRRVELPSLVGQVLPNPALADGPVSLHVQQAVALPVQLTITDLQGRVLHQQELPAAAFTDLPLRLPALQKSGLYLLRLTSATGTATQKLLVQ